MLGQRLVGSNTVVYWTVEPRRDQLGNDKTSRKCQQNACKSESGHLIRCMNAQMQTLGKRSAASP